MKIGNVEKPTFYAFRSDFLMLVGEITGMQVKPEDGWIEISNSEIRERIIKEFIRLMEERYGFEIALKGQLNNRQGSVEGVAGELYHIFSTMFLVEVINSKIRSGQRQVDM